MKDIKKMIEDCQEKGEPFFILRGKDMCAIPAINAYLEDCMARGCHTKHICEIEIKLSEFQDHLRSAIDDNTLKIPD